jgi:hypothetical protein
VAKTQARVRELSPISRNGARRRIAERPRTSMTPVSWRPDPELPMREWAEQGRRLGVLGRAAGWWIGDWLRFGNARFGERYTRAARITGYDVQTLMNMVYVASRYDVTKRRENLSWSHHAELAALDPTHREPLLDLAESQRMSVRCLREEMRRLRRLEGSGAPEKHTRAEVVCPACGCVLRERPEAVTRAGPAATRLPEPSADGPRAS